MKRPEILAPAGSAPAMVAAVQCGADALYLGAGDFNARRSAENFENELDAAVMYCHARGVRVYVTLNTMVREDEISRLENTIRDICLSGADGVIVQDLGVARAVRQMAPSLPLHASTQLAVHNPQGVEFLVKEGFSRVVLAREMRFGEIARCKGLGAEIEVFVHGALCVSCSGQCLFSSMVGGRSGNRGLCAQPCRMKYRLNGREGYLLSTKDLCTLGELKALIEAGADSLKIEGRLKRPEYVAETTAAYRAKLDALTGGAPFDEAAAINDLKQMFNRGGFTRGYGPGVEDAELMFSERPNHMGVEIGICKRNGAVEVFQPVDGADALVLRGANGNDKPVRPGKLGTGQAAIPEAKKGEKLVRLVSQNQLRAARERYTGERRKFPVDMELFLHVGKNAALHLSDGRHSVRLEGDEVQAAKARPADPARIRAQMEKLGDTPFEIRNYQAEIDENAYLPVSALNALRRRGVEMLIEIRGGASIPCSPMERACPARHEYEKTEISVQSAHPEILARALQAGADSVIFAPEDVRSEALETALSALPETFDLALPPVLGEKSLKSIHLWAKNNAPRIRRVYLSNIGHFDCDWPGEAAGDYQLNIANNLSVSQLEDWGVQIYTPSVELNRGQIQALGGNKALILYGRLPLMQLRHCPLRALRGDKGPHALCRRCDACPDGERCADMSLTDRTGAAFPLRRIAAHEGCVVQLLNSASLMLLRKASALPKAACWRLLPDENEPIEAIVHLHKLALSGGDPRQDENWAVVENKNTTTGHYFRGAE